MNKLNYQSDREVLSREQKIKDLKNKAQGLRKQIAKKKRHNHFQKAKVPLAIVFLIFLLSIGVFLRPSITGLLVGVPEVGIQSCSAQNLAAAAGTFDIGCDNTYPSNTLFLDDITYEVHQNSKAGATWAGIRINSTDNSVTDCSSIDSVYFCYKWWTSTTKVQSCDISVDADNGASFTAISTACPGTTEPGTVTCTDITALESWSCDSFFNTGAFAKSEIQHQGTGGPGNFDNTWDVFYFNVSYNEVDTTPPTAITNLQNISSDEDWIYWTWTNPTDLDFDQAIIYIDGINLVNTTNNFYNTTSLSPNTDYTITVHTKDNFSNVNFTDVNNTARTKAPDDQSPPAAVTSLQNISNNEIWIYWTWTNPSDIDFGQAIIYIDGINLVNTTNDFYNATGLTPDMDYTITIHTKDLIGNVNSTDVNSTARTDSTNDITPPAAITNLNDISSDEDWIYWTWINPTDLDFDQAIIYINEINLVNTTNTFYNATSFLDDTDYTITVHTKDLFGNVNLTDINNTARTTKAPDLTPPAGVTNLVNQSQHKTWIYWTWTNPLDIDFDHVEIWVNDVFQTNTSGTSFNATGLTPDSLNIISTRTVDSNDNINFSWVNHSVFTWEANNPTVTDITPIIGEPFLQDENVTISAVVVDESVISSVQAFVVWNSNSEFVTLTDSNLDDNYTGVFNNTANVYPYNVTIIAEDNKENINDSESTLFDVVSDTPFQDTYVSSSKPTATYSSASLIITDSVGDIRRGLIRFDISYLPEGVVIDSAVMNLFLTSGNTVIDHSIFAANDFWNDSVTYNTQPSIRSEVYTVTTVGSANNWYDWNLTNLVESWYNESFMNFGLMIREDPEANNGAKSYSSSNSGVDVPELLINYSDISSPKVADISPNNQNFTQNHSVLISTKVTDNINVSKVYANISWSSNSQVIELLDVGGFFFEANFSNTSFIGDYTFNIIANDSSNLINNSEYSNFTIIYGPTAPKVLDISDIPPQSITEAGISFTEFFVLVEDLNGASTITNVDASFNKPGESSRYNSSCIEVSIINSSTVNYSCSVGIWYWDAPGDWSINVSASDLSFTDSFNESFLLLETSAFVMSPSFLTWDTLFPNELQKLSINDPLVINNTGNANISNVTSTAFDLVGQSNSQFIIPAKNFSLNIVDSCGGSNMFNNSAIQITNAILPSGNNSVDEGKEEIFACLKEVPFNVSQQTYSAQSWIISII